jgi:hypothetical protein
MSKESFETRAETRDNAELESYFQKLKEELEERVVREFDKSLLRRDPEDWEADLGVRREGILPQFQGSVEGLFRKGYKTFGSGFDTDPLRQGVRFREKDIEGFKFPAEILKKFQERGVILRKEKDAVVFCLR